MLNLDHPMTRHVFAAARAEDAILEAAKRMTVATRSDRIRERDGCGPALAELRRLACDHFADVPSICPAIDALEQALAELAALPVADGTREARFRCPACQSWLERRGKYGFWAPLRPTTIYCSPCFQIISAPLTTLSSGGGGFGTDFI